MPLDDRLLSKVSRDSPERIRLHLHRTRHNKGVSVPVVFANIALTELLQEVLVMRDDNELEIGVVPALIDDARESDVKTKILHRTKVR